ncbi:MAG: carbon-nitrogen hydrolase family protein [Planctomycetes bacterium]|nr:carbon-nitrogen hydrolase family protein [Planctomycetota bacterium]
MTRRVKIATCSVETDFSKTQRAQALRLVEEAGERGADIVCLPEYVGSDCVNGQWSATPVPGPVTEEFARLAAKYEMFVITPLVEENGRDKPYNTAVLIDRKGRIAGRYRKTHLCLPGHGEGEKFLPGDELPVFETDFGRIAVTICMDIHYPELYTALALRGAEVIFWPSGAMDYTGDLIESLVNARAIDNQAFFVCSHYIQLPYLVGRSYGRSRVIDCMGRVRADTGHFPGVAVAEVDLDQTYPMWYQGKMLNEYPTMRETFFKTRRPELYGEVIKPVTPAHHARGPSKTSPPARKKG